MDYQHTYQKKARLKIALATDWYLPRLGGTELSVHRLAKQLQKAGHIVHIITTIPGPSEVDSVQVHRIPSILFPKFHFTISAKTFKKMREIFIEEKFDVIHCHGSSVPPVAAGSILIAKEMGIPTICTIRSLLGSYQILLKLCDWLLNWSNYPVVYSGNCAKVASELKEWIDPKKIHVLSNGLDPEEWKVPRKEAPTHQVRITSVMRVTRRKRPLEFVKMIAKVHQQLPQEINLRVKIVGDGDIRKKVIKLINRFELQEVIEVTGFVRKNQVKEIFSNTDIYVQPTIVEAFGNAALEARAAGLPVIARREGGIKEFIQDKVEGFIVDSDQEMANRIYELTTNAHTRNKMIQYNQSHTPAITWENVLKKHLHLYHQAIDLAQKAASKRTSEKISRETASN